MLRVVGGWVGGGIEEEEGGWVVGGWTDLRRREERSREREREKELCG